MRTDPVIDLGVVDLGPDRPDGVPHRDEPGRPAGILPARAWLLRWWPLVSVTLLLVASTSAADSITPDLRLAFQVPVAQATSVTLTGETLYLATGTPVSVVVEDPEWTLSAYRLSDGTRRWTVQLDVTGRPDSVAVRVVDGVPLVTGWRTRTSPSRPTIQYSGETTAYEPDTGEPRWVRPGFLTGAGEGRAVLDLVRYEENPPRATSHATSTVDLATGAVLWGDERAFGDDPDEQLSAAWVLSDDGRYLASLGRDGRLVVRDLRTGAAAAEDLGLAWRDASLVTADGLLRVSILKDRRRTLAVYDLFPPAPRWTVTEPSPAASLTPCGPVFCLSSRDGVQGLDPETGATRWRAGAGWTGAAPVGPPWPSGQLLLSRELEDDTEQFQAVDAATGRETLELGAWRPLEGGPHAYPLVFRRDQGEYSPGHPDYDPGRVWLGRVEPAMTGIDVLGSLEGVRTCALGERHLACVSTHQRVEVWQTG